MPSIYKEKVLDVTHYNEGLFSFKATRNEALKFENGEFVMIGLEVDGVPLLRAYSIVSPNYAEELEFLSIIVPDGPLTSRLKDIKVGDELLVSAKPTGTLLLDHLLPGKNLYLLSTGTGLAPIICLIQDPETYERFDKVIITHGVRLVSDLAYRDFITKVLPENEFFGEEVQQKLLYYPTVTREEFNNTGRLTDAMISKKLFDDLDMPEPNKTDDRFMICGGPDMLKQTCEILDGWGFEQSEKRGFQADYVIERAFVER